MTTHFDNFVAQSLLIPPSPWSHYQAQHLYREMLAQCHGALVRKAYVKDKQHKFTCVPKSLHGSMHADMQKLYELITHEASSRCMSSHPKYR